ncbi:filamentous hemagglutinin N-terminal domain-containing protein [Edwardsiella hoshinae]|uniref:Heme:hemopexin utilization protein A n=3 Tax=Edwardsiella hoshinae TaxID=93378 RepID=A0A376DJG9_9GAMM|nr:filamentous hemagglutinin N-terminal domain-containing protein [Edwardsiella hoshinae]QPR29435.1 filamentous hemagglutinin N-terminal domain-containing protein [Edwardsiella hoshinae]STC90503.1 Heme:hemopexin utilization protein A [Edwardsiella hoshinae]
MNNIYQLKYDRRRQQWVVVSELVMGAGKGGAATRRRTLLTLTPLALVITLLLGGWPGPGAANPVLPTGGQIVAGQGTIQRSGSQMTVNQRTPGMVATWHSFDIGASQTVQFVQPNSQAIALNRVTGGRESQILGALTANGQVMLVNPAGVMLGHGAKVNTAGMVASTKHISTADFMAGRYTFSGGSQPGAQIVNQGSLAATPGGYIVLVGDRVRNEGRMSAPGGKVLLAAADKVTLQLDNAGLAAVSVDGRVVNALVENRGLISADNGQVYLTARGQAMLLDTVVNNSGTVEAKGLSARGGELVLDGGDSGVVRQSGELLADSDTGRGGTITLEGQHIQLAHGSRTSATGRTGGGEVYVGGGWQGKDSRIRQASKVVMDNDALIDVSATARGQGGTAVLWSNDYTHFRGTILARGGQQGGDGGRVETSSHHNLQAFGDVDASAVKGNGGEWLLDPFDISIVGSGSATNVTEGTASNDIFTPTASGSQVLNTTINDRLNQGTQVTIKTQTASAGTDSASGQWGNITVNADIQKSSGTSNVSLTLAADGNINITDHRITSTAGKLAINLLAAGSHSGSITLNNATLSTNGGNLTLGPLNASTSSMADAAPTLGSLNARANSTAALTVNITNSTLNASGGVLRAHAVNPNINLAESALSVVYNGSNNLVAVSNSTLTAATLILTGTQNGENGRYLPVYLTNATLKAAQDLLIVGDSSDLGNASRLELRGCNTLSAGGNLAIGNTRSGIFLNGTAQANSHLTANHSLTLIGLSAMDNPGVKVFDGRLQANDITLDGSSMKPTSKGLELNHSTLLAAGNIHVSGNMTVSNASSSEGFGAHIYNDSTLTAAENITITGYALNGTNGGLNVHGGTFSAKNTLLSGTSQQNNIGIKIGGNVNVTAGNLSITGSANRINTASGVTGVTSDGNLTLNVSAGKLNISATVNDTGNQADNAATSAGLNLSNTTLTANSAEIHGVNTYGNGTGFALNNVSLAGALADGANLTLSSQGSAQRVTNSVNLNGGLSYSAFQRLQQAGIDNDTVLMVTPDTTDLAAMGLNATTGWIFDGRALGAAAAGKAGRWGVVFSALNVTTTGAIWLGGVGLADSNLTARSVTLSGDNRLPLTLQNSTLHASGGDIDLAAGSASLRLQNSNLSANAGNVSLRAERNINLSGGTVTATAGQVTLQAGGNISLSNQRLVDTRELTLLAAGRDSAIITLNNATLNASDGAITLAQRPPNASRASHGAALTVKLADSILDAARGAIRINAINPNVDMTVAALRDTVRNGGSLLEVNNSCLTATTLTLTGTQQGANARQLPVYLTNATLRAAQDLRIVGLSAADSQTAQLELRGRNMLNAGGNLTISNTRSGIFLNGTAAANSNLTANHSLTLNGSSLTANAGLSAVNANLTATQITLNAAANQAGQGLMLRDATLNASQAALQGSSAAGEGFALNNVTLNGGLARGANLTLSSQGSAANVTNTLNINGGLSYSAFQRLQQAGIDNDTAVWVRPEESDWDAMGLNTTTGWHFDASQVAAAAAGKSGLWGLTVSDINATTAGAIQLTGVNLTRSNLTGSSVSLTGVNHASLILQNSQLTASSGNVSLRANGSITLNGGSLTAATGQVTVQAGGEHYRAAGNALTLDGVTLTAQQGTYLSGTSARNGVGVKLNGTLNVTQGNLTVNGSVSREGNSAVWGIDGRNATLNLSASDAVLTMTGAVVKDSGNASVEVIGLDLSGESVLNASRANLSGISVQSGYGFRLSPELQGGLTTNGSLTLSSQGSGVNVSNWIGARVNATIVKHMIETNVSIGSYTETGMENLYTQDDFTRWLSDGDLRKDFGDFGLKFSNITITAGDIDLTGVSFTNSSLTASSGNLTINNKVGALDLVNSTLNAALGSVTLLGGAIDLNNSQLTAAQALTLRAQRGAGANISSSNSHLIARQGGISLTGLNGAGIRLSGTSTITAQQDILLQATAAAVNISGPNTTSMSTLTSNMGNIRIAGNGTRRNLNAVHINNLALTAERGRISVIGVSDGSSYGGPTGNGIVLSNTVVFNASENSVVGRHITYTDSQVAAVAIGGGARANITFIGNTSIDAESDYASGLLFNTKYEPAAILTFQNGTASIKGKTLKPGALGAHNSAGVANGAWRNKISEPEIIVNNATLGITASSYDVDGMASFRVHSSDTPDDGARWSGYKFSGDGDVNITATSNSGDGINLRLFDNTRLTGKLTILGESQSGAGVSVPEFGNVSLVNASITGRSQTGSGILMNAGDIYGKKINLNGNVLNGTSASGSGIDIHGNNVSITNGSLNGTSQGNGAGVQLTGGSNYTIDGATLNGHSRGGVGVSIGGNLTLANGVLAGVTLTGSGVNITGNVNSANTTISGRAIGRGNGVELAGTVSGGNISGAAIVGSGVRVSGDSTLTDVALRGDSVDGSGVAVNANLTNLGDSRVSGSATGNGNGVELAGQVSGGNVSGAATVGSGVRVSGDSTLTDVALRGDSVDGSGVAVNANLTNLGDSRVSGSATGNGNGVELAGQVSGGNVSGAATVGSGVRVSGDSTLTDVALRGDSVDGSGVAVNANLTNLGDSRVSGSATGNGNGVELAGQVSGGNVSGAATVGSGVRVSGDSTLTDVALRGDSVDGSGVAVNANLTNLGDSRVSGSATGNGTGVELAGQVTGGALQGQANRGTGLRITGNSSLYGVAVTASSQSGRSTLINALLTTLGGTSLNGQEQQDSSAMRHQVFTRQKQLPHAEEEATARQASGYRAAENPVSLDICTGDGPCQHVTLGGPTRP